MGGGGWGIVQEVSKWLRWETGFLYIQCFNSAFFNPPLSFVLWRWFLKLWIKWVTGFWDMARVLKSSCWPESQISFRELHPWHFKAPGQKAYDMSDIIAVSF